MLVTLLVILLINVMLLIIVAIPLSISKLNNTLMPLTSWGAPSSSNMFPRVQLKPANMLIVILESLGLKVVCIFANFCLVYIEGLLWQHNSNSAWRRELCKAGMYLLGLLKTCLPQLHIPYRFHSRKSAF